MGLASIGYARVSTVDQKAELQIDTLRQAGRERVFVDHGVSGTRASRPELERMIDHLRSDQDEVVVWKLDRLGRNTRNLLVLIDELESRGIQFRSLTEGIATAGPMGTAMLTVMSAFVQLERDQLAERTKTGMAAAAERGRKAGRREVTAEHAKVKHARELKDHGLSLPTSERSSGRAARQPTGTSARVGNEPPVLPHAKWRLELPDAAGTELKQHRQRCRSALHALKRNRPRPPKPNGVLSRIR